MARNNPDYHVGRKVKVVLTDLVPASEKWVTSDKDQYFIDSMSRTVYGEVIEHLINLNAYWILLPGVPTVIVRKCSEVELIEEKVSQ